ncbi:NAD(P)H-hydrate dehydratase [Algoriphagus sp. CAU 1675]|uniref:NAD(P)H-hydrate dehydratase n=1 Tax=Algoriphagus sp. CAU 1675 TaxID=3032597 RepID=UPI0023DC9AA2|nr:NAD(P)H-hydrate dehydratase [Algoriphagus sp. CAU 1675]MDF2157526.1 NAD(P)H-hydrate dehydratase [Algoriphagus sp. CAU 1675]
MIKILQGNQVKELDRLHCEKSGQSSYELMEMAATSFVDWFMEEAFEVEMPILVYVGAGNNGGDGLAISRMLHAKGYQVSLVKCFETLERLSPDALRNYHMLSKEIPEYSFKDSGIPNQGVLIDAFLGVGLKGALKPEAETVINQINIFKGKIISVDLPSGMPAEGCYQGAAVRAAVTVTFAFPKLSLLYPEHVDYCGDLVVRDIGIDDVLYEAFDSQLYFLQEKDVFSLHRGFHRFSHKGDFGRILLVGGSPGKMGAISLAAKSALRTGSGLVTCHIDETERGIVQGNVPEAMCSWGLIPNADFFDAIGVGPGWGQDNRKNQLESMLQDYKKPMVFDADALNILAKYPDLIQLLPEKSILTPHIGEFARLAGPSANHEERIALAREFARRHKLILVLKGANTLISFPDGKQVFNSSGTPFMGTGGAGDVLTGMITSFLGMGYSPENSALCAVYHHGLAGELAGKQKHRGMIASDIIEAIPETFVKMNIF